MGIIGYGAYVPRYRLPAAEVARVWTGGNGGLPVKEKAVAGLDEDVITMSIEAARNALARAGIDPAELRAVWVGSESHPYAVKPSGTVVAEAIGAAPSISAGDWEFACKAGTEAMVAAMGLVGSGMAQLCPGDRHGYRPGPPGRRAGIHRRRRRGGLHHRPGGEALAVIEASYSYVTDTPDFWRRAEQKYPEHGQRFTGEPAYFKHITEAGQVPDGCDRSQAAGFRLRGLPPAQHQIPAAGRRNAGLQPEQIKPGLLVAGDRQHLCRRGPDRPDRHAGYCQTGRPHLDGLVWLGRRLGCLLTA